eukprot:Nk52_evm1s1891 gene=Nk52_evmTU1s1891
MERIIYGQLMNGMQSGAFPLVSDCEDSILEGSDHWRTSPMEVPILHQLQSVRGLLRRDEQEMGHPGKRDSFFDFTDLWGHKVDFESYWSEHETKISSSGLPSKALEKLRIEVFNVVFDLLTMLNIPPVEDATGGTPGMATYSQRHKFIEDESHKRYEDLRAEQVESICAFLRIISQAVAAPRDDSWVAEFESMAGSKLFLEILEKIETITEAAGLESELHLLKTSFTTPSKAVQVEELIDRLIDLLHTSPPVQKFVLDFLQDRIKDLQTQNLFPEWVELPLKKTWSELWSLIKKTEKAHGSWYTFQFLGLLYDIPAGANLKRIRDGLEYALSALRPGVGTGYDTAFVNANSTIKGLLQENEKTISRIQKGEEIVRKLAILDPAVYEIFMDGEDKGFFERLHLTRRASIVKEAEKLAKLKRGWFKLIHSKLKPLSAFKGVAYTLDDLTQKVCVDDARPSSPYPLIDRVADLLANYVFDTVEVVSNRIFCGWTTSDILGHLLEKAQEERLFAMFLLMFDNGRPLEEFFTCDKECTHILVNDALHCEDMGRLVHGYPNIKQHKGRKN